MVSSSLPPDLIPLSNMRSDKLAQILSHGGVFSGAKVLVFESLVGLVVGSIAYRMGGQGEILSVYFGQQPHFDLVDRLNLSPAQISTIRVSLLPSLPPSPSCSSSILTIP
jgi:hypothetical protein